MGSIYEAGYRRLSSHVRCIGATGDFCIGLQRCGVRILGQKSKLEDINPWPEVYPLVALVD
jgi:hypothetical protein